MIKQQTAFAVILLLLVMPVPGMSAAAVDYDTTRVRVPESVHKSVGDRIVDIPGEILKLPIYAVESLAYGMVMFPPFSKVLSLIELGGEAKPYVPVVGFSTRAGFKFGFGVRFLSAKRSEGQLKLKWYYSTSSYQSYQMKYHSPQQLIAGMNMNLYARYKKRPRERFYGVGIETLAAQEVSYTKEDTEVRVRLTRPLSSRANIAIHSRYQLTNITDGRDPTLEGNIQTILANPAFGLVPGQFESLRHVDVGISFEYDGRDHAGQPTRGGHIIAQYERILGVGRSTDRNFDRVDVDIRYYVPLWRKRVIALRGYFTRLAEQGITVQQPVPFFLAGELGGADKLRGYTRGRFIDNDVALVSTEYRYPIFDVVDAFIFWEAGRVFSNISKQVVFDNWKRSVGFGLRIWNSKRVSAMTQIANSDESTRFYFELGATW